MDIANQLAASFAAVCLTAQLASAALALPKCRAPREKARSPQRPPVTIVRPVCGLEPYSRETLGATFALDWPDYEIIFCVDDPRDPVVAIVNELIEAHPDARARLLSGFQRMSTNPKLDNMAKGWRMAQHDWIVFLDSNVSPPTDYLDRLFLAQDGAGCMVSAPPAGAAPCGFWSEVECCLLNAFQARVQYAADSLGFGFAQGKTLFFARRMLENGGFEALATEPAEDAAATRLMRKSGGKVRLAGPPFPQFLGRKSFMDVFSRQMRWARLRRATFPMLYLPEILVGLWPPLLAVMFLLAKLDLNTASFMSAGLAFAALWYVPELVLTHMAGWPLNWRSPLALLVRDLLLPMIYLTAFTGKQVVWHGVVVCSESDKAPFFRKATQRLKPFF